jgi:hypothetical protein
MRLSRRTLISSGPSPAECTAPRGAAACYGWRGSSKSGNEAIPLGFGADTPRAQKNGRNKRPASARFGGLAKPAGGDLADLILPADSQKAVRATPRSRPKNLIAVMSLSANYPNSAGRWVGPDTSIARLTRIHKSRPSQSSRPSIRSARRTASRLGLGVYGQFCEPVPDRHARDPQCGGRLVRHGRYRNRATGMIKPHRSRAFSFWPGAYGRGAQPGPPEG